MLINPRLTDYYGIAAPQASLDFAIPFLNEDIPLCPDPFLLWRLALAVTIRGCTIDYHTASTI